MLWLMAEARRQERRRFALDVRELTWREGKFDVEQFIRQGYIMEFKAYPLPDTPAIRKAREDLEKERRALEERQRRNGQ